MVRWKLLLLFMVVMFRGKMGGGQVARGEDVLYHIRHHFHCVDINDLRRGYSDR